MKSGMPVAAARTLDALEHRRELRLPTDEWDRIGSASPQRGCLLHARDRPHANRTIDALERGSAEIVELEAITQEAPGRIAHHHRPRRGERLEPGRDVRCAAEHRRVRPVGASHLADDDRSRVDTDARLHPNAVEVGLRVKARERFERMARPAHTARSASSSCATGYPKCVSNPSPRYCATEPPKRATTARPIS